MGTSWFSSISVSTLFFAVSLAVNKWTVASQAKATTKRSAHSAAESNGNRSKAATVAGVRTTHMPP